VLLDWRATRRPSAFDLLKGSSKVEIEHRLEIERKEKQAEAEASDMCCFYTPDQWVMSCLLTVGSR
jgi:hypothetical protein